MACQYFRVDTTDQTSTTQDGKHPGMIYAEDRDELFVWWSEDNNLSGFSTSEIHFRRVNTEDHSLSTEITIQDTTGAPNGLPHMVRLNSGRLVCVFGQGSSYELALTAKVSNDHGDTWSSGASLNMPVANIRGVGLATDGTNAWYLAMKVAGGGDSHDIWAWKYTATTDTWGSEVLVFDSNGIGGTPGTFDWVSGSWWQGRTIMVSATVGMMIAARCEDGGTDAEKKVSILRTTDAWTTAATVIDLAHYPTADDGGEHNPVLLQREDGRIVASWTFRPSGASTSRSCVIAYSDDLGLTWTITGIPDAIADAQTIAGFQFRASHEPALYLHTDGRAFLCTLGTQSGDAAFILRYRKFFGSEEGIADWTLSDCTFDWNVDDMVQSNLEVATAFVTRHGIFMVTNTTYNGATERIYLLVDTEITEGEDEPGPPAPLPSGSGADENNTYVRKVLGPNSGGWSFHTKNVTCWMSWDEGDEETGREVPILTAGYEVWPMIQDPALVGIINRIEAPDLYSDRHYVFNETVYDPLKVEIITKKYLLSGPHDKNAMRAIYLSYARAGAPFNVELWVDDKILATYAFADTQGKKIEKFRACPTFENTANTAWLRIQDESNDPLFVDSMEFVFIKKGHRGNA